jgi:hypothetical protein
MEALGIRVDRAKLEALGGFGAQRTTVMETPSPAGHAPGRGHARLDQNLRGGGRSRMRGVSPRDFRTTGKSVRSGGGE